MYESVVYTPGVFVVFRCLSAPLHFLNYVLYVRATQLVPFYWHFIWLYGCNLYSVYVDYVVKLNNFLSLSLIVQVVVHSKATIRVRLQQS